MVVLVDHTGAVLVGVGGAEAARVVADFHGWLLFRRGRSNHNAMLKATIAPIRQAIASVVIMVLSYHGFDSWSL